MIGAWDSFCSQTQGSDCDSGSRLSRWQGPGAMCLAKVKVTIYAWVKDLQTEFLCVKLPGSSRGHAATLATLAHDSHQPAGPIWFLINPKVRWRKQPSGEQAALGKTTCQVCHCLLFLAARKASCPPLGCGLQTLPPWADHKALAGDQAMLPVGTEERQVGGRTGSKEWAL